MPAWSLNSSATFTISKSSAVINGDVGVAANGDLEISGGGNVYGTIYAGAGATLNITGGSSGSGGVVQPFAGDRAGDLNYDAAVAPTAAW